MSCIFCRNKKKGRGGEPRGTLCRHLPCTQQSHLQVHVLLGSHGRESHHGPLWAFHTFSIRGLGEQPSPALSASQRSHPGLEIWRQTLAATWPGAKVGYTMCEPPCKMKTKHPCSKSINSFKTDSRTLNQAHFWVHTLCNCPGHTALKGALKVTVPNPVLGGKMGEGDRGRLRENIF